MNRRCVLWVLKENVLAATVPVAMPDGKWRLVGSIGLNDDVMREADMLPLELCGTPLTWGRHPV